MLLMAGRSTGKKKAKKAPAAKKVKRRAKPGTCVVHPNVSRMDYGKNHGYWVRFRRTDDGVKTETNKMFSDSVYDGPVQALRAAIAWRKKTAKQLRPPLKLGAEMGGRVPPGYHYVKRKLSFNYRNGVRQEFDSFFGFLRIEDRKNLNTRWSVAKWGKAAAERRCHEWVAQKMKELEDRLQLAEQGTRGTRRKVKRR